MVMKKVLFFLLVISFFCVPRPGFCFDRQTARKHLVNGNEPNIRATVLTIMDAPSGNLKHSKSVLLLEAPFGKIKYTCELNSTLESTVGITTFQITAVDSNKTLTITSKAKTEDNLYHYILTLGSHTIRIDTPTPDPNVIRQFVLVSADPAFENQVRQTIRLGWMAPELRISAELIKLFGLNPGEPGEWVYSGQLKKAPLDCSFDQTFGYPCPANQQVGGNGMIGYTEE